MSNAIERIKGYCTEVTQAQWEELVRVADEVGMLVGYNSRKYGVTINDRYARLNGFGGMGVYFDRTSNTKQIPFPDFLAKLRGVEEWTPKAGEMVEVRDGVGADWFLAKYVGHDGKWAVCRPEHHPLGHYTVHNDVNFRPLRPAITRAEAESQLGKRIID